MNNPLNTQIGGDHYKNDKMQPIELICLFRMNFIQGCIVKYVTRYKNKKGLEDLEKIIHYAQLGEYLTPKNYFHDADLDYKFIDRTMCVYIEANNIDTIEGSIIFASFYQDWGKIINYTKILIERWNNKNK
ncbi:MAG: DUF3310 domain-containing protein [Bacteroidaceae bacterium]